MSEKLGVIPDACCSSPENGSPAPYVQGQNTFSVICAVSCWRANKGASCLLRELRSLQLGEEKERKLSRDRTGTMSLLLPLFP